VSHELGRALFVQLEPGLDRSRREGIFSAIKLLPGVGVVSDLSTMSRELVDMFLLPDGQKIPVKKR
jgi:hypothetical protein